MARPNLRVIAGRPIPVLTQEYRTESLSAIVKRWLDTFAEAFFSGLAIICVVWATTVLILSLQAPR